MNSSVNVTNYELSGLHVWAVDFDFNCLSFSHTM